jgi:N-acetylneuraminic acid mutarotase
VAGGGSHDAGVSSPGLPFSSALLYDPLAGTFAPTGGMNVPRWGHTATRLLDGRVLVTGGVNSASIAAGTVTNTAEIYDPATHTFTMTNGPMNSARFLHTATLLADGRVLIAGGGTTVLPACILCFANSLTNTADVFDPATGLFTPTSSPLATARQLFTSTLLPNGQVLIAGGFTLAGSSLSSAEIFDPLSNAFRSAGNLTEARGLQVAALVSNGKVFIAGPDATAELYDPAAGTFTATGSLVTATGALSAAVLPNGTVILPGGLVSGSGPSDVGVTAAQVYDPSTGSFILTGRLISGEGFYGLAPLLDGTILMTGGENGNQTVLDAEVYYSTAPLAPMAITSPALAPAATGTPYTQILLEKGGVGTLTWTETGSLPAGMSFSNQGVLSGTPTVAGSFPLTFTVTDSSNPAKSASRNFTLAVVNTPLVFTSTTMPTALAGKPYTQTLPVAGGTQPYNGTVTNGTPPPGLTLVGNVLIGTPSGTGNFTFTVTVTDSSTPTQTATQTLTIAVNTLVITTTALPSGIVGVPYNATISTAGGTPPLSFSLATVAFPPGLSMQQGALAGTPTQAGNFFFSETVVDSSTPAQTATRNYEVTIAPSGTRAPANVTFVSQPQNSTGGQILTGSPIRVHVTDANNAPITGTSVAISFNGAPPCSSAVLSGTLNGITNGAGNAVFPDLSIDRGQLGYTLLASTGSASAISNAFNVEGFCGTGSLATARALLNSVTLLNGKVLIAGGAPAFSNQAVAFSSAELYDPVARSFTPVGSMHSGRSSISIALLQNGLVLVAGGFNGSANLSSAELFDPATNTFTLLPGSMITARGGGTATLLANGKVLITGGTGNAGVLASAEIFDPATNTFTATSQPMSSPRAIHEAILLPNGKVLITGGFTAFSATGPSNPLASAELYDPVTDTFTLTGSMAMARYEHASALLFTGKVLVFGGFTANNFSVPLATAEIYDPSAGTFSSTATATQASAGYLGPVPVLPDGTVFLYGGGNAQIYDPALGTFRVTGNTTTIQAQPVTSLLSDGTVLVTGGVGSPTFNTGLANAEIFYPSFTPGITITLTLLPNATQNQPYSQVLLEQGGVGALTWTLVANSSLLPPGLTLSSSGIISGTPTQFGAFPITVQVTDSSVPPKSATITYGLIVLPQLQFLGNQLVTAFSGTPYNNSLLLVGGTAPYTITLAAGTLPAGLVFTPASSTFPTGQINGTTTAVGNYTLTFQATDSSVPPQSTTAALTLGVTTPLTITNSTLPNGSLGASYSATVSTTGGLGTLVFGVASGSLPPGVTMGFQGVLSGIPASTGTFSFTVLGFDQSFPFQIATQSYTLTITTAVAPIVLSPDPLNLLANSSGTMSVTLNAAAGASGQVVTLSSSNSSVASVPASVTVLPQATTATFQVTAGTSTNNATITASAAGFTSGNGSVVVVGCPSTVNLTLCGRYSMGVVGFSSSGGPVAGGVTFVADNSGHIVSGTGKFNQSVAGPTTSTITGGSYVMDSSGDGRGVLTLIDSTASSRTYRFVLESLANAGVAQVEEFDNSGTLASGIIAGPEAPPVPQIPANTTVALNVEGINGSGQLAALLGEFQVGSSGCDGTVGSFNSLAGEPIVTNTAGTVNTALTATGSCTASDPNTGLGTAQITISGGTPFTNSTLKFVYIAVGSGTTLQGVFFLEVDPIAANQPILSGLAEGVTVPAGGFNASSPACPCLLVRSGTTDGTSTTGHSVGSIVRILTTPGIGASGTLTGVLDQNAGGTITLAGAWPYTSYTVDSNGVGTITGTGSPVHFIITGSGSDFTMQTLDESVSVLTGSFRAQNATTIQAAGAPYIVGLGNGDFVGANRNVESAVGVITPSGATSGTLTGTVDVISSAGPVVGATASGTYAIDSTTGRGTGIANLTGGTSSVPIVIYARRVRQFVVLDVQSSDPYQFGARLQ